MRAVSISLGKRTVIRAVFAGNFFMSACASMQSGLPISQALVPVCAHPAGLRIRDYNYTLFFDQGDALLSIRGAQVLKELAQHWKRRGGFFVEVSGHTDAVEDRRYSPSLALDRANATRAFLVAQGVEANRIVTQAFGARRQVVPNKNSEPQNRRVEILPFFRESDDEEQEKLQKTNRELCKIWVKDHCLTGSRDEHAGEAACSEALDVATAPYYQ